MERIRGEKKEIQRPEKSEFLAENGRENFKQKEGAALEGRLESKLKKAFIAITAMLVLASGAEAYAQERANYISSKENQKIEKAITFEKIEKSKQLQEKLISAGIEVGETKEFIDFINSRDVPIEDLEELIQNVAPRNDKMMTLKTYGIAYEAVERGFLSQKYAKAFEDFILNNLKNGILGVAKKGQKSGQSASYNTETDTYSDAGIDLSDSNEKAVVIHELVHAYQDGAYLSQKRINTEHEAYSVQAEYVLRQSGIISQDEKGNFKIGVNSLDKISDAYQKMIILEKVLHNVKNNRTDAVRDFILTEDGIKISDIGNEEAVKFLEERFSNLEDMAKMVMATSSNIANLDGNISMDEVIKKDGFRQKTNE